jgi:hypothetical protein
VNISDYRKYIAFRDEDGKIVSIERQPIPEKIQKHVRLLEYLEEFFSRLGLESWARLYRIQLQTARWNGWAR